MKAAKGFRLAQSDLTLEDHEGSKTKVAVSDVKYVENGKLQCWTQWRLCRQQQPRPFAKNLWPSCLGFHPLQHRSKFVITELCSLHTSRITAPLVSQLAYNDQVYNKFSLAHSSSLSTQERPTGHVTPSEWIAISQIE